MPDPRPPRRGPLAGPAMAALVALGLATCDAEEPPPPTPAPTPAPSPSPTPAPTPGALPRGWVACTNEEEGYRIGHPPDWHATAPGLREPCTLFDPQPFEVEPDTEAPVTAMTVRVTEQTFEQTSDRLTDPTGERILMRERVTVAGRSAIRFETVQTKDLLLPAGTMRYGYAVDHDGRTLLVMTVDVPDPPTNYDRNKQVVDRAVETLRFQP